MALQRIWEPISIGSAEVKNRVARAANTTSMMPNSLNDDFIAYHRARARGGVGLSILEAGSVHPNSQIAYLVRRQRTTVLRTTHGSGPALRDAGISATLARRAQYGWP